MTEAPLAEADLPWLIPAFCARVRAGESLGPIFDKAIDDWPIHLKKLQAFWSSIMLTSGRKKGQPMVAHVRHAENMTADNIERWLTLWRMTTEELLFPSAAAALQEKTNRIAESLRLGVQFYRERKATS
jgi:hemoglobin